MKVKPALVYIVDDDQVVTLLHTLHIKRQELAEDIHAFLDAKIALQSLHSLVGEDQRLLIFLDLNMPEMNGWEFLTQLQQQQFPLDIKVIIVTSSLSKSDKEKSAEFDLVIDIWEKPMAPDQILQLKEQLGDWISGIE